MIKIERIENIFWTIRILFSHNIDAQGILSAINAVLAVLFFTTENTSQSDYIAAARSHNHLDGDASLRSMRIPYPIQSNAVFTN